MTSEAPSHRPSSTTLVMDHADEHRDVKLDHSPSPEPLESIELQDGARNSDLSAPASSQGQQKPAEGSPGGPEWVMGPKLYIMMAGVTIVAFLMLLDTSIISTVSSQRR